MMRRGLKLGIIAALSFLVLAHVLALVLFFGPASMLLNLSGIAAQHQVEVAQVPVVVRQAFSFVQNSPELILPEPENGLQKVSQAVLRVRYEREMEGQEKQEILLSTLPFGDEVVGLNAASLYYFQKPLVELNQQEANSLAGFFRVFGG